MDWVDRCEELAAAWGVLPQVVLQMTSVHVRILWDSYSKRQRRTLKWEAQLAGMNMSRNLIAGIATPDDVTVERQAVSMGDWGYPVKVR